MTVPSGEDPEQRISDLERTLGGGVADTGERARPGLRAGWLLLGLLGIALVAGGAAILSARTHNTVTGAPLPAEDLTPTAVPTRTASPTSVAPIPAEPVPVPSTFGPAPGSDAGVSGVGTERTIACTDNVVTVSGVDNVVTITGHCRRVDVSGMENQVSIEESEAIVVSGVNNEVTYRSGDPKLTQSGFDNSVQRR